MHYVNSMFPIAAINMSKSTYGCDAPELESTDPLVEGVKNALPAASCDRGPFISLEFRESSGRDYIRGRKQDALRDILTSLDES